MKKLKNFLKQLLKRILHSIRSCALSIINFIWKKICQGFLYLVKLIKKYRLWIFFILMIIGGLRLHFYIIEQLKQDEKNLIEAFQSGRFDEYQKTKQEAMYKFQE